MNIDTINKKINLSFNGNDDELVDEIISTLFDNSGRRIKNKFYSLTKNDIKESFDVIKGLDDDFDINISSDNKIKGYMKVSIKTIDNNVINMYVDHSYVITTKKNKYNFY